MAGDEVSRPKQMQALFDSAEDQGRQNFQVDGMGTVANDGSVYSTREDEEKIYFGQSSTYNFVHQVQRILQESNRSFLTTNDILAESHTTNQTRRRIAIFDDYVLPPKKEADGLMVIFWSRVYPLYPFLDQNAFKAAYEDLWASNMRPAHSYLTISDSESEPAIDDIPESRRFHILLNAIFAVCSHCEESDTRERQIQRGALFWKRWKMLLELDFNIFNRPRLIFIQALLYSAVYIQSSSELTGACWNITSIAVRMSQALGLHCDRKSPSWQQKRHVETFCLHWRTWAGCVMMDRKSATIRECLTYSDQNAITFLCHSIKLQEHIADLLTKFYDDDTDATMDGSPPWSRTSKQGFNPHCYRYCKEIDDFVGVEAALVSWETELPESLRLPELAILRATPETFSDVSRQSVVLRCQNLYAYILASRPSLLQKSEAHTSNATGATEQRPGRTVDLALRRTFLDKTSEMCINATVELIDLLDLAYQAHNDTMPESWYTIFYLYNCGMTLLIHRHLRPNLELKPSWTKCLKVLRHYQTIRRTALKCVKLLELAARNFAPKHWMPTQQSTIPTAAAAAADDDDDAAQGNTQEESHLLRLSCSTLPSIVDLRSLQQQQVPSRAPGNGGRNCSGDSCDVSDFQLDVSLGGVQVRAEEAESATLPELMFDDSIDFSWLSNAPFELSPEELTGTFW
ncbi:Fungal specific transcription factor domain-containing protein [Cladophialophora immunda]|nr:Fungal specific transcription factor domain-containing protein [Cladophialophora immunda]